MDSDDVAILLLCLHWLHIFPKSQKLKDLAILVVVLVPERERERERVIMSIHNRSSFRSRKGSWRRRASIVNPDELKGMKTIVSQNLSRILLAHVVMFFIYRIFVNTSVALVLLSASLGYNMKDTTLMLASRSSNNSLVSEILIFILRRVFHTDTFQEKLRKGLCSVRAGLDFQPSTIEWPSDVVIQRMSRAEMETVLKSLLLYPKTRDLDPFVCLLGMCLAQRDPSYYDNIPQVKPVSNEEDFVLRTTVAMDIDIPLGYLCPERGTTTWFGRLGFNAFSYLSLWIMDNLQLFEETKKPMFFDNIEQAAVFFHYIIRPHIPRSSRRIAFVNVEKDVEGSTCAHAFAGIGAWRLKAVQSSDQVASWSKREASPSCVPPRGSVAVIDCSWQANMTVREGYIPYGAAAFFDKDKKLIGIWNEAEKRMQLPCSDGEDDEPWRWAQFHWKTSIAYEVFSVGHLLETHWSASNTLVQVARDLSVEHPIRRLIKPFTWGSAFINSQAIVNLVQTNGVIVRASAVTIEGIEAHIEHLMGNHAHYGSFDKFVNKMGEFPESFIESVPMVEDGKAVWGIFEQFVEEYLSLFYTNDEESDCDCLLRVEDDPELKVFWEHARIARSKKYPLELGKLSFEHLKEFLSWTFFWSCAVHALVANFFPENTLPFSFAGRVSSSVRPNSPDSDFQIPIHTWMTQALILANTTIEPVPFLIEAIRDTADFFGPNKQAAYGQNDRAKMTFVTFADRLEELSQTIDSKNEKRGWLATNSLDPKVMRCSTSL